MNQDQLIGLFISQNQTISGIWSLYVVVVLGMVGFIFQRGGLNDIYEKLVFVVFSVFSATPIYLSTKSLFWLSTQIGLDVFKALEPIYTIFLHGFFDIIVVLFIVMWRKPKDQIKN